MTYTEGTSLVGINVNYKNGDIDWAQVAENGVDFAMIRLGYRGYGTGRIVTDTYFETNLKGALENDIEVGVYFFSQAINEEEAVEEAQYCMDLLQDYDITYPIVFDWEPYDSSLNPRTDGLSDEMLTKCAVAFCQAVEDGGYESMVYSNLTYFYLHYAWRSWWTSPCGWPSTTKPPPSTTTFPCGSTPAPARCLALREM